MCFCAGFIVQQWISRTFLLMLSRKSTCSMAKVSLAILSSQSKIPDHLVCSGVFLLEYFRFQGKKVPEIELREQKKHLLCLAPVYFHCITIMINSALKLIVLLKVITSSKYIFSLSLSFYPLSVGTKSFARCKPQKGTKPLQILHQLYQKASFISYPK